MTDVALGHIHLTLNFERVARYVLVSNFSSTILSLEIYKIWCLQDADTQMRLLRAGSAFLNVDLTLRVSCRTQT